MRCKGHLSAILACLGAAAYLVCHVWGYVVPSDVQALHADLLRISVLGWSGMNLRSLLLGTVQWAVWGWVVGHAFTWFGIMCARSCRHHGPDPRHEGSSQHMDN